MVSISFKTTGKENRGPFISSFSHSWALLILLVRRELKIKYRGSVLGYFWSMLNPLLFMLIIAFVLGKALKGGPNYDLYVLSGILFWNMTVYAVVGGTGSFISNASLLQKVRAPIWVFALVPLGSGIINLGLALLPYSIVLLCKGVAIPWTIIAAPLVLVVYAAFLAGLSLFLATTNVFFRDVAHVIEPILQLTFYATPIIYDRKGELIPESISGILGLNPFTRYVEVFRAVIFKPEPVEWSVVCALILLAITSLAIGTFMYRKKFRDLAYRL